MDISLTGTGVLQLDPWLEPFKGALKSRYSKAQRWIKILNETEGGLDKFSRGYEKLGLHIHDNGDIGYTEWAPNALRAYVIGEFSRLPNGKSMETTQSLNFHVFRWME